MAPSYALNNLKEYFMHEYTMAFGIVLFITMPLYLHIATLPYSALIKSAWNTHGAIIVVVGFIMNVSLTIAATKFPIMLIAYFLMVPVLWFAWKLAEQYGTPHTSYWTPKAFILGAVLGAIWVIAVSAYYYAVYDLPVPSNPN